MKWLLEQRKAGLGISKAVDLWKQLELDAGQNGYAPQIQPAETSNGTADADGVAKHRHAWVSACMAFDERGAMQVLSESFALFPVETVCFDILLAGVAHIGQEWYEGNTTVQQEHFATSLATRQLDSLLAAAPAPTRNGRILTVCPPQEEHVFVLLLLTLLLRRAGWDVVHLGANVPIEHISETVRNGGFQLVASSAQQLNSAAYLMELAYALREEQIPLVYGGRVFNLLPALQSRIPGHFLGKRLQTAPQMVENIMVARPPLVPVEARSDALTDALHHYRRRLPAIDATVEELLDNSGITYAQLSHANMNMGLDIKAALTLGDLSYLGDEMAWVEGLLRNHDFPVELLDKYLVSYYEALQKQLDARGQPILDWLEQML